jgi:hypothetical protein
LDRVCQIGQVYDVLRHCRLCWRWDQGEDSAPHKPLSEWPLLARLIARWRTDADVGLGDTIARHAARFGADAFQRLYKRITGADCGCSDRQAALNSLYPYPR